MKVGTGVAADGVMKNGSHWYYTFAQIKDPRGTVWQARNTGITIQRWFDKNGFPIKAIYHASDGFAESLTTVVVKDRQVLMEEQWSGGTRGLSMNSQRSVTFQIPKDTIVQISQGGPIKVKFPVGADSVSVLIIDPVAFAADTAHLRKVAAGRASGQETRYLVETSSGEKTICVATDGRLIWTLDRLAYDMVPTFLTRYQVQELSEVATRMGA